MNNKSVEPKYSMGNPPKSYNKKKSISVFGCIRPDLKCPELLKAKITSTGEVYLLPIESIEGIRDFHLSYHKSGEFHWTDEKKHLKPLYGEADYRKAFRLWLKFKQSPCFCIRKGKQLDIDEIKILLSKIQNYLPFDLNIEEASKQLQENSRYILTRKGTFSNRGKLLRMVKGFYNRIQKIG